MTVERRRHPTLVLVWKIASISVGSLLILAGLVMLVTPGPGGLAIFAGLAMLSPHSRWAKAILVWTKKKFHIGRKDGEDPPQEASTRRKGTGS